MEKAMKTNELQRRYAPCDSIDTAEVRAEGEAATLRLHGTPIVYGREAVLYDSDNFRWVEVIEPGAAREALLRAEQVLLWNHDRAKPMAARKNNTLSAREDSTGVHIDADVSGTSWGREGYEAIKAGLIDKMSFGFFLKDDGFTVEISVENGKRTRKVTIKKLDRIIDFSPVTYPAYEDTGVSARSVEDIMRDIDAEEKRNEETKKKISDLLGEFKEQEIGA